MSVGPETGPQLMAAFRTLLANEGPARVVTPTGDRATDLS
jgi:hypothetical protein